MAMVGRYYDCMRGRGKIHYSTMEAKNKPILFSSVKFNTFDFFKNNPDDFLDWLRGITDAEGCFYIAKKYNLNRDKVRFDFYFKITFHVDDQEALEFIHKTLKIGRVHKDSEGDAFNFIVSKQEDVEKIIVIFDKHVLNTSKYLNYRDWRKAFLLYKNRNNLDDKLVNEILKIKEQMNNNRSDYTFPAEHEISISSYWLLGFIEGDGSFNVTRKNLEPVFIITLNDKEFPVIYKIREFLLENLGFDYYSKWKIENSSLLAIYFKDARSKTKRVVRIIIRSIQILNNYLVPFFNKMNFITRKGLDFSDFKLVCRIIYGGGHKDKTINALMLKLINNMNNNRLSTSKKPKSKLTNNELTILNNVSSTYKYLPDGSIINRKTGIVLTVICIYIISLSNGEDKIIATTEEVARELNINVNTLSYKLRLHREGVKINDGFVKRVRVFGPQSHIL